MLNMAPRNDPWGGGAITRSERPVDVRAKATSAWESYAEPSNVATPSITITEPAFARNNRGSNVRIPYARVVSVQQDEMGGNTQPSTGLASGELAWILGSPLGAREVGGTSNRQIVKLNGAKVNSSLMSLAKTLGVIPGDAKFSTFNPGNNPRMRQCGIGVNRMQRLATTDWLTAEFKEKHEHNMIDLLSEVSSAATGNTDCLINEMDQLIPAHASMVNVPDLCRMLQEPIAGNNAQPSTKYDMGQGLSVMEQGPFLRSHGTDRFLVKAKSGIPGVGNQIERHLGSEIAQRALAAKLRGLGMMDWTPDCICLSKLESSDDAATNDTFDVRAGQLFNIGVRGPCITKTWTGDVSALTLPMDKVFVLIVATVLYDVGHPDTLKLGGKTVKSHVKDSQDEIVAAVAATKMPGAPFKRLSVNNQGYAPSASEAVLKADAPNDYVDYLKQLGTSVGSTAFKALADDVRNPNEKNVGVTGAILTDFSLRRVTSSYLANKSHFDGTPESRCGLSIEFLDEAAGKGHGRAEYFVGGWCIGTVIDSAASRSMSHNTVRSAPSTMAINVDVNVDWWSADKLYQHYQGVDAGDYTGGKQTFDNLVVSRPKAGKKGIKRPRNPGPDNDAV